MIPTLLRTALVLLLLLPAGAFAQAVPDASRLIGHFKVAGNDDAGEVNIYLHDVNTYYVRLGKTWFKVTRGSESEDTLKGGVEQPGDVSSTIQSGADDALAGIFNGNTSGGSQANSGSTLEIKVAELNRYEATIARGSEKKRFTLQRALMRKPASGYDRGPRGALTRGGGLLRREGRGGRLLEQLLVVALDRALALADVDRVPEAVGQDLDLDVPAAGQVALEVEPGVAEGGLGLGLDLSQFGPSRRRQWRAYPLRCAEELGGQRSRGIGQGPGQAGRAAR